jgi:hypothetical protein
MRAISSDEKMARMLFEEIEEHFHKSENGIDIATFAIEERRESVVGAEDKS